MNREIVFGVASFIVATAAGIISGQINSKEKPAKEVAVQMSERPADKTAATIANLGGDITAVKRCVPERVGTAEGIVHMWKCGDAVLGPDDQAELNKLAGEDATEIVFEPRGNELIPRVTTGGEKPNLDPIPVEIGRSEITGPTRVITREGRTEIKEP